MDKYIQCSVIYKKKRSTKDKNMRKINKNNYENLPKFSSKEIMTF